jgi:hypothetical protein
MTDKTLEKLQADIDKKYDRMYVVLPRKNIESGLKFYKDKLVTLGINPNERDAPGTGIRHILVNVCGVPEDVISETVHEAELKVEKVRRAR